MQNSFYIQDVTIINPDERLDHASILVTDGKIISIEKDGKTKPKNSPHIKEIIAERGTVLIPGMIDVHIHGTSNADTMDATPEALQTIASSLPSEGTTSFLATTITQSREKITAALKNAAAFAKSSSQQNHAEMIGVHLEGPFFSAEKAGAQPKEYLQQADKDLFQQWQKAADGLIKWVSLAPERDPDHALIRYLKETGVVAAAAHSNATLEEVEKATENGVSHVTHLFNGMSGLHHRTPGVASAALLLSELTNEIIADGIHVHPAMVNMAYRMKGSRGLLLITDSIRAKCLRNGEYDLGGQTVTVKDNKPLLADGTIAGSMLKMNEAARNIISYTGCLPEEAVAMASWNAACKLGIENRKGSIEVGKDADLVLLGKNYDVIRTWCRGNLAYEKSESALN